MSHSFRSRVSTGLFVAALTVLTLVAGCGASDDAADLTGSQSAEVVGGVRLPLHTEGRWIVGAGGHRVKLASVNWFGAEEDDFVVSGLDREELGAIARRIRTMGFNSVRLPWSNEMYERNPVVDPARLAANRGLQGQRAMQVFDAVVDALARAGLMVILDNHTSAAGWCCNEWDWNGLWFTDRYSEDQWVRDWEGMARRYRDQPAVVGFDLRNELRAVRDMRNGPDAPVYRAPVWGGGGATDWRRAARRAGNAVLAINPRLLVIVEGLDYARDLRGVADDPLALDRAHRLVYSVHDYPWHHTRGPNDPRHLGPSELRDVLGARWGYLLAQGRAYTAPVWVGEFGTCHDRSSCTDSDEPTDNGYWFRAFARYLREADIDWSYWALNGTQARATEGAFDRTGTWRTNQRVPTSEAVFGILDPSWRGPAYALDTGFPVVLDALTELEDRRQGP